MRHHAVRDAHVARDLVEREALAEDVAEVERDPPRQRLQRQHAEQLADAGLDLGESSGTDGDAGTCRPASDSRIRSVRPPRRAGRRSSSARLSRRRGSRSAPGTRPRPSSSSATSRRGLLASCRSRARRPRRRSGRCRWRAPASRSASRLPLGCAINSSRPRSRSCDMKRVGGDVDFRPRVCRRRPAALARSRLAGAAPRRKLGGTRHRESREPRDELAVGDAGDRASTIARSPRLRARARRASIRRRRGARPPSCRETGGRTTSSTPTSRSNPAKMRLPGDTRSSRFHRCAQREPVVDVERREVGPHPQPRAVRRAMPGAFHCAAEREERPLRSPCSRRCVLG